MFLTEIEEYIDSVSHNNDLDPLDCLDDVDDAECDDLCYEPDEQDSINSIF